MHILKLSFKKSNNAIEFNNIFEYLHNNMPAEFYKIA